MAEALVANSRTDFGKGAARQLRRSGQIPAVVYGDGGAVRHVSFNEHDLTQILRHHEASFEIKVDGKQLLVAPRDIQRDYVARRVEHVDLVIVTKSQAAALAAAAEAEAVRAAAEAEAAAEAAAAKAAARAAAKATEEAAEGEGAAAESAE